MEPSDLLWLVPWTLWQLTVPGYVIVQIIVLLRSSGAFRWVAALPLLFMVPAYILFVLGISQGGDNNLSWLLLILPSPIAFLYVVAVTFVSRGKQAGSARPMGR